MNISAYMSSIRPYLWMSHYNRLKQTNLTFEMVIVGPYEANFELPNEIKFYKSDVKPSQCFHAAGQMCQGETMLQIVDDVEYTENTIENMYAATIASDNIMVSATYFQNNVDNSPYQNIAGSANNPYPIPILPVCGMFPRKAWVENRGLDKRFDGCMSELDLYMRLRINGYNTVFIPGIVKENTQHQNMENTSLCGKYWYKDRPNFINLWSTNGILYPIRNDIVRTYDDKDILTVNQYYG